MKKGNLLWWCIWIGLAGVLIAAIENNQTALIFIAAVELYWITLLFITPNKILNEKV